MQNNISAKFVLNPNNTIKTNFKTDTMRQIKGEGVIKTTLTGNNVTITSMTYIHEQGETSDSWLINHNLNKFPSVTLVDSAGTQFQGRVEYIDENSCLVTMNGQTKGKAYLN